MKLAVGVAPEFPPVIDLRKWCPPTQDQGDLGSCTANAITSVLRWNIIRDGGPDIPLSRLQLYYDERREENSINEDSGAEIRDGIKCVKSIGVGREDLWPYDVSKFKDKPPKEVYECANLYGSLTYQRVQTSVVGLKTALSTGFPVIIGIVLFESFQSDEVEKTGIVHMPNIEAEEMLGGHCMYVVGYGQRPKTFTVHNSWSEKWGDGGFCYIPEAYIGSSMFGVDYWAIEYLGGV